MNLKARREKKEVQSTLFHAVAGPVLGAVNLLKAHAQVNNGLNLGTVKRASFWGWNTYYYLASEYGVEEAFGKKNAASLKTLLEGLDEDIRNFDWDAAGNLQTDLYEDAMKFYNDYHENL